MICNLMKIICADDGHYPHMKKCLRPHQHLVRPILNSYEWYISVFRNKSLNLHIKDIELYAM